MALKDELKKARMKTGMTQGVLAKKLGYTTGQIVSNWERGIAPIPLVVVAEFCNVTKMNPELMRTLLIKENDIEFKKRAAELIPFFKKQKTILRKNNESKQNKQPAS